MAAKEETEDGDRHAMKEDDASVDVESEISQALLEASVSAPSAQSIPPSFSEFISDSITAKSKATSKCAVLPKTDTLEASSKSTKTSMKNTVKKATLGVPGHSRPLRGHRSPVKPFFCCGSELSLDSLVDGLDLKDGIASAKGKDSTSIEVTDSSEECYFEDSSQKRGSSSYKLSLSPLAESHHAAVVRRKGKKKDKKRFWSLRFRGRWNPQGRLPQSRSVSHRCDLSHHSLAAGCSGTYHSTGSPGSGRRSPRVRAHSAAGQLIDLTQISDFDHLYPTEGIDEIRMRERAEEVATGIEVNTDAISRALRPNLGISGSLLDILRRRSRLGSGNSDSVGTPDSPTEDYSLLMNSLVWRWQGDALSDFSTAAVKSGQGATSPRIHTQVDFIHFLVPHLVEIMSCPFYWGVMDRYEAERLLDNKPEGSFLLRDSAQEDFLFSVSFRRYNRSLHARVEQWNHRFSFDALDPAVFSADSVCELMDHYKDASCCMFFEPLLTRPLARNFTFSLQHICRAAICDRITYDQIRVLPIPNSLKQFLQVYHYKQKVRVRHFDGSEVFFTAENQVSIA